MDVADRIEAALGDILPVYGQTPEFGATRASGSDEPQKYAVYIVTERGAEYAEGEDGSTEYLCRLSVFTPRLDYALYRRIKAAMRAAGFGYAAGGQTGTDGLFPYVTHYYLDFLGVECNAE